MLSEGRDLRVGPARSTAVLLGVGSSGRTAEEGEHLLLEVIHDGPVSPVDQIVSGPDRAADAHVADRVPVR